jgi:hypothetical protein
MPKQPGGAQDDQEMMEQALDRVRLAILKHLYDVMLERGIENLAEAEDDEWVLRRLVQYDCFSRNDVKRVYNTLAKARGLTDKVIQ